MFSSNLSTFCAVWCSVRLDVWLSYVANRLLVTIWLTIIRLGPVVRKHVWLLQKRFCCLHFCSRRGMIRQLLHRGIFVVSSVCWNTGSSGLQQSISDGPFEYILVVNVWKSSFLSKSSLTNSNGNMSDALTLWAVLLSVSAMMPFVTYVCKRWFTNWQCKCNVAQSFIYHVAALNWVLCHCPICSIPWRHKLIASGIKHLQRLPIIWYFTPSSICEHQSVVIVIPLVLWSSLKPSQSRYPRACIRSLYNQLNSILQSHTTIIFSPSRQQLGLHTLFQKHNCIEVNRHIENTWLRRWLFHQDLFSCACSTFWIQPAGFTYGMKALLSANTPRNIWYMQPSF